MKQGYGLWVAITVAAALIAVGLFYTNLRGRKSTDPTPSPSSTSTSSLADTSPTPSASATTTDTSPTPTPSAEDNKTAAKTAYSRGDYLTAIARYKVAIDQTTDTTSQAELWNLLGNSYRDNKSLTDALTSYDKAIALNPKLIAAYVNASNVYITQNNTDKAKSTLEAGLKANPNNFQLQQELDVVNLRGTEAAD